MEISSPSGNLQVVISVGWLPVKPVRQKIKKTDMEKVFVCSCFCFYNSA